MSWGKMSLGQNDSGAKCPWGKMSPSPKILLILVLLQSSVGCGSLILQHTQSTIILTLFMYKEVPKLSRHECTEWLSRNSANTEASNFQKIHTRSLAESALSPLCWRPFIVPRPPKISVWNILLSGYAKPRSFAECWLMDCFRDSQTSKRSSPHVSNFLFSLYKERTTVVANIVL